MDNEQQLVTTKGSTFYHSSRDCPALQRGQKAALTNGWQQHEVVPYTPTPGGKPQCQECAK